MEVGVEPAGDGDGCDRHTWDTHTHDCAPPGRVGRPGACEGRTTRSALTTRGTAHAGHRSRVAGTREAAVSLTARCGAARRVRARAQGHGGAPEARTPR